MVFRPDAIVVIATLRFYLISAGKACDFEIVITTPQRFVIAIAWITKISRQHFLSSACQHVCYLKFPDSVLEFSIVPSTCALKPHFHLHWKYQSFQSSSVPKSHLQYIGTCTRMGFGNSSRGQAHMHLRAQVFSKCISM